MHECSLRNRSYNTCVKYFTKRNITFTARAPNWTRLVEKGTERLRQSTKMSKIGEYNQDLNFLRKHSMQENWLKHSLIDVFLEQSLPHQEEGKWVFQQRATVYRYQLESSRSKNSSLEGADEAAESALIVGRSFSVASDAVPSGSTVSTASKEALLFVCRKHSSCCLIGCI